MYTYISILLLSKPFSKGIIADIPIYRYQGLSCRSSFFDPFFLQKTFQKLFSEKTFLPNEQSPKCQNRLEKRRKKTDLVVGWLFFLFLPVFFLLSSFFFLLLYFFFFFFHLKKNIPIAIIKNRIRDF